jgi:hypothetical protein
MLPKTNQIHPPICLILQLLSNPGTSFLLNTLLAPLYHGNLPIFPSLGTAIFSSFILTFSSANGCQEVSPY